MTILDILTYPDKFLAKKTEPVTRIDDALQKTIDDMAETMYAAPGVGLAAPQVGIGKRFLVFDASPAEEERKLQVLINPEIISSEGEVVSENEGCLSVPEYRADVKRAEKIVVKTLDREGTPVTINADGMLAIVLQHEIDHLDGILFIDRISKLKREMYKRRVKKNMRNK